LPYLTPETIPADKICRSLFIPNDRQIIGCVLGALEELTYPYNWEHFGAVEPPDIADAMRDMFDDFSFNVGVCRVVGEIVLYAGDTSPNPNWLPCDGSSVLRADYPDLFTIIGTVYGSVDGTHFNIPDLRGRVVVDAGSGSGLTPRAVGDAFGEETHTLVTSEMPGHTHTDTGHTHVEGIAVPAVGAALIGVPIPSSIPGVGVTGVGSAAITGTGGDGAHNNVQPSLAMTYLIVALP